MDKQTRTTRLLAGLGVVLVLLVAGFYDVVSWIPTWGATPAEVAQSLPGDKVVQDVGFSWDQAITIDAPVDQVWPWVAQIGDDRGGFYSYTFIENLIAGKRLYVNADQILPQFQDPQPGDGMIFDYMQVAEAEKDAYLLAQGDSDLMKMNLTWIWALSPLENGQTRLFTRIRAGDVNINGSGMPAGASPLISLTGFVMERKMMEGIKLRAEGGHEAAWVQPAEIVLWLAALGCGIAAAVAYLRRRSWLLPFVTVVLSIVWLFGLTYLQPALWIRLAGDAVLLGLLVVKPGRKN